MAGRLPATFSNHFEKYLQHLKSTALFTENIFMPGIVGRNSGRKAKRDSRFAKVTIWGNERMTG
jgi:hypothetical protein